MRTSAFTATQIATDHFDLVQPTTIVPVSGMTQVTVRTTGKALIQPQANVRHRDPYILLAECEHGRLLLSPRGRSMSLHLNLPVEEASEEQFAFLARMLYRMYLDSAS